MESRPVSVLRATPIGIAAVAVLAFFVILLAPPIVQAAAATPLKQAAREESAPVRGNASAAPVKDKAAERAVKEKAPETAVDKGKAPEAAVDKGKASQAALDKGNAPQAPAVKNKPPRSAAAKLNAAARDLAAPEEDAPMSDAAPAVVGPRASPELGAPAVRPQRIPPLAETARSLGESGDETRAPTRTQVSTSQVALPTPHSALGSTTNAPAANQLEQASRVNSALQVPAMPGPPARTGALGGDPGSRSAAAGLSEIHAAPASALSRHVGPPAWLTPTFPAQARAGTTVVASARSTADSPSTPTASAPTPLPPVPAPSAAAPSGAYSSLGFDFSSQLAVLLALLSLAALGLFQLRLPPSTWRPMAFVSLLERPG